MVAFLIYWFSIFVSLAWVILSVGFSLFYLARKENGNLWAFAFFNLLVIVFLAIILVVYRTWDFNITLYSSAIRALMIANGGLSVIQAVLGRVKKPQAAHS